MGGGRHAVVAGLGLIHETRDVGRGGRGRFAAMDAGLHLHMRPRKSVSYRRTMAR